MKLIINVVNWFRNIDQKGSYGPHTGIMDSIPHENIHEVDKKCGVFVKNFFPKRYIWTSYGIPHVFLVKLIIHVVDWLSNCQRKR